jgi:predicted acylesterase/phospholipase RssA
MKAGEIMRRDLPLLHKKPGTALVLSGGATKAFYFHTGVLKTLDMSDVTSIVGTSAGALVGTLIAGGATVDQLIASLYDRQVYVPHLEKMMKQLTAAMLFRPALQHVAVQSTQTALAGARFLLSLPLMLKEDLVAEFVDQMILSQRHAPSFFNNRYLEELLKTLLPSNRFADTTIDLYVTATCLDRLGRAVFNGRYDFEDNNNAFMTNIPISRAVQASTSVPGMFEPVKIRGKYYIDGEVRQTLSMDIGLALADRVIVSHTYQPLQLPENQTVRDLGWFNIIKQAVHIALYERIAGWREVYEQQFPEKQVIWIEPNPGDEEFFAAPEFSFRPEIQKQMVESGERAARRALAETSEARS